MSGQDLVPALMPQVPFMLVLPAATPDQVDAHPRLVTVLQHAAAKGHLLRVLSVEAFPPGSDKMVQVLLVREDPPGPELPPESPLVTEPTQETPQA
jgi:hypothetical protein